jgi:Zn-dependent M32 family carboxypeptidase
MKRNIHSRGRSTGTLELVQRITGEKLSAAPLLQHLERRYMSDKR